ncbi:hypothetical protein [Pseudomonas sp. Pseusp97]|uniref:hypothetical protein n=1 Tax=Pseudomonas sp. Pseusp97 TaxID=3243065 RepID=UPI0039A756B5
MAAELMENGGTSRAARTSMKNSARRPESVSPVKLFKSDADSRGANKKLSRVAVVSSKVCYAGVSSYSPVCNKTELFSESSACQTLFVSSLKQQLPATAEVYLQAFAISSELTPATFPKKARARAAAPRVTESRRERRHPAGRQRRHHPSRAPRRAGSQG